MQLSCTDMCVIRYSVGIQRHTAPIVETWSMSSFLCISIITLLYLHLPNISRHRIKIFRVFILP